MDLVEAQRYEKRTRGWLKCKMLPKTMLFSRTIIEQIVDVTALGSGMRRNAMWHVPHYPPFLEVFEKNAYDPLR